jgi:hypothetical protein
MWAGGPINGTFFRWANKWYTYPIPLSRDINKLTYSLRDNFFHLLMSFDYLYLWSYTCIGTISTGWSKVTYQSYRPPCSSRWKHLKIPDVQIKNIPLIIFSSELSGIAFSYRHDMVRLRLKEPKHCFWVSKDSKGVGVLKACLYCLYYGVSL